MSLMRTQPSPVGQRQSSQLGFIGRGIHWMADNTRRGVGKGGWQKNTMGSNKLMNNKRENEKREGKERAPPR